MPHRCKWQRALARRKHDSQAIAEPEPAAKFPQQATLAEVADQVFKPARQSSLDFRVRKRTHGLVRARYNIEDIPELSDREGHVFAIFDQVR